MIPIAPPDNLVTRFPKMAALIPIKPPKRIPKPAKISMENDTREFFMQGMGKIKEKILLCDETNKVLKYSAIETPAEIKHHLACIELTENETGCDFSWSTEIDPEIYGSGVEQGMISSLEQLKKILDNQLP